MAALAAGRGRSGSIVVAAEARGFILGGALARELGVGFVPARKPGKLPGETVSAEYILEYGVDALEMHADALATARGCCCTTTCWPRAGPRAALVDWSGRGRDVAGSAFLVELSFLGGRSKLDGIDVQTLIA